MSALRAKDFTPGVPMALMLRSTEPKQAKDNGFGAAMMFSSSAGPIYVDPDIARQIIDQLRELAVKPNELIRIVKIKTSHGGHRWHVERPDPARNPQALLETVPAAAPDSGNRADQQGKNNSTEEQDGKTAQSNGTPVITPQSAKMCAAFMAAVDAIIEVQAYATRRGLGLTFSEESVRAIGLTIYIGER
jgi:hypothetical protein